MNNTATATTTTTFVVTPDPRARLHFSDTPGYTRCGTPAALPANDHDMETRKVCFLCESAPAPAAEEEAPAAPADDTVTVRIATKLVPAVTSGLPELAAPIASAPVKQCGPGSMVHLTATRAQVESYRDFLAGVVEAKAFGPGQEKWRVTRALRVANTDLSKTA